MKRLLSLLLCLLLLCGCAPVMGEETAVEMRLFAINVGKADCLLLAYEDCLYMIDTGRNSDWGTISAALKMLHISSLTGVIVTHTDSDHAGGCAALAASGIDIGTWYASAWYADVKESKHPVKLAAASGNQSVRWLRSGDELPFGTGRLRVLGPTEASDKENCNSVVLLAEGGGGSMLLAGDMEFPEEEALLASGLIQPCTVLKVGNHGESDATSDAFVRAVKPSIALISTSTNEEPDTPAGRVLKALRNVGAATVVTQQSDAGVLITVQNGAADVQLCAWTNIPAKEEAVRLTAKENKQYTTTVTNTGSQDVDVSGWFIRSERGGELFVFPEGSVIRAGQSVVITCLSTNWRGDYLWMDEKVWHKSKDDAGTLYDVYGREINRLP